MAKHNPSKEQFFNSNLPQPGKIQKQNLLGIKSAPNVGAAGNLHPLLNVQGAAKGGGTLRAYDVNGRIYWYIEGYDDPTLNPGTLYGGRPL